MRLQNVEKIKLCSLDRLNDIPNWKMDPASFSNFLMLTHPYVFEPWKKICAESLQWLDCIPPGHCSVFHTTTTGASAQQSHSLTGAFLDRRTGSGLNRLVNGLTTLQNVVLLCVHTNRESPPFIKSCDRGYSFELWPTLHYKHRNTHFLLVVFQQYYSSLNNTRCVTLGN